MSKAEEFAAGRPGTSQEPTGTGTPIGRHYIAYERLGAGAMGTVYRGVSRDDSADLAIKVLRAELAEDPRFVARFVQERTILRHLGGRGVVRVVDLVVERDTLAIVMERVRGGSLRQHLQREGGRLPTDAAVGIVAQILDGLANAHAQGVLHRDIKPENVLVDDRSQPPVVKVGDFGISGLVEGSSVTRMTGFIGTPAYMAPELSSPGPATAAVDVYATGVIGYELLNGPHLTCLREACRRSEAAADLVPDAVLAAIALEHGATVVSFDRDFARFDGVDWIRPG